MGEKQVFSETIRSLTSGQIFNTYQKSLEKKSLYLT